MKISVAATIAAAIADLERRDVPRRIWERDHTVWKPKPIEISDRLGWLTVAGEMRQQIADLQVFADEVKSAGFRYVALLGIGGSSLGTLALQQLFGSVEGYPELIVQDTTIPGAIRAATRTLDCSKTLFIVSSKSGTTIEPNALYRYFRATTQREAGVEEAGRHFVAICDGGTSLERLGNESGFRRVFVNRADIGGRFSVQSLYGLVPAALMGIDIEMLLDRVEMMIGACGATVPAKDNPGAWLGAATSAHASQGRDKLTVVATESLGGFSLWVEQLLAESTGKEGKGVIPITGEPHLTPGALGNDRLFVYVRLDGDNTRETDAYIERVENAGIPTIRLSLADRYDIGAEFFRWEFATAVIGSLLGINTFDQPDVQHAKDNTARLLTNYRINAAAPSLEPVSSLAELIAQAKHGDYLAITAYANPTPQIEQAVARLRASISERSGIPTTFAYGPRYLHSTGQLHKGGPSSGLFLQLTGVGDDDVTIPGEAFTFGALAAAQAKGDLDALEAQGSPVARVNLDSDAAQTIDNIAKSIS